MLLNSLFRQSAFSHTKRPSPSSLMLPVTCVPVSAARDRVGCSAPSALTSCTHTGCPTGWGAKGFAAEGMPSQSSIATAPAKRSRTCWSEAWMCVWPPEWESGTLGGRGHHSSWYPNSRGKPAPAGTRSPIASHPAAAAELVSMESRGFLWWRCTWSAKYSLSFH